MKEKYTSATNISKQELAGCLPEMNWSGNFNTLMDRLYLLIALFRTRAISEMIVKQVMKEAKKEIVPYHEYVINELQYEMRIADPRTAPDLLNEEMIIQEWAARLQKRFPPDLVDRFFTKLKKRRGKRVRTT